MISEACRGYRLPVEPYGLNHMVYTDSNNKGNIAHARVSLSHSDDGALAT